MGRIGRPSQPAKLLFQMVEPFTENLPVPVVRAPFQVPQNAFALPEKPQTLALDLPPPGARLRALRIRSITQGLDLIFDRLAFPSPCQLSLLGDRRTDYRKRGAGQNRSRTPSCSRRGSRADAKPKGSLGERSDRPSTLNGPGISPTVLLTLA